jgi:Tol biopolymer transport system component
MKENHKRKLIILGLFAALAALAVLFAIPAGAAPRAVNGQIVFDRFDPALGDSVIYTVNPDGSHQHQVLPLAAGGPTWSPDGSRIATNGWPGNEPDAATAIINPDDGSYRVLPLSDPTVPAACYVWSPDGKRLACQLFSPPDDPSRNGMYSIRSSDGGGLTQITSTPLHDIPGDYAPDGRRLVFGRFTLDDVGVALFVINANGTGLKQITPTGTLLSEGTGGNWSPQGNEIVFSRHVTEDAHSSLWEVHSDGSGLHEIHVQGLACGGANDDPNGIGCFDPRWSPDGTKIVFVLSSADGRNIYTINADGSGLFQVTHGGADDSADWGTHPLAG